MSRFYVFPCHRPRGHGSAHSLAEALAFLPAPAWARSCSLEIMSRETKHRDIFGDAKQKTLWRSARLLFECLAVAEESAEEMPPSTELRPTQISQQRVSKLEINLMCDCTVVC